MPELELTRSRDDRRTYDLAGVGSMRLDGWLSRGAEAEAGGSRWRFNRRGMFKSGAEATNASGAAEGTFDGRALRRGGAIRWRGREFALRPASAWRERYALADGERELVLLDGKGWGKRPVKVTVEKPGAIEPGLLLFAAFVVRGLDEDAGSAAGAAAATGGAVAGS